MTTGGGFGNCSRRTETPGIFVGMAAAAAAACSGVRTLRTYYLVQNHDGHDTAVFNHFNAALWTFLFSFSCFFM
ncbi:hypothetical protein HDK64DRAFT_18564 [Phyllosticta capitalensis]